MFGVGSISFVVDEKAGQMVRNLCTNMLPASGQPQRNRSERDDINVADTLRTAADALRDRTDLGHAPALAGLLYNRADDMEHNIALWRRSAQDVAALVEQYYGVYLAVARIVVLGPRCGVAGTDAAVGQ